MKHPQRQIFWYLGSSRTTSWQKLLSIKDQSTLYKSDDYWFHDKTMIVTRWRSSIIINQALLATQCSNNFQSDRQVKQLFPILIRLLMEKLPDWVWLGCKTWLVGIAAFLRVHKLTLRPICKTNKFGRVFEHGGIWSHNCSNYQINDPCGERWTLLITSFWAIESAK